AKEHYPLGGRGCANAKNSRVQSRESKPSQGPRPLTKSPHPPIRAPSPIGWERDGVRGFWTLSIVVTRCGSRFKTHWHCTRTPLVHKSNAMPLRVLVVPDKFKGTLTAQAA